MADVIIVGAGPAGSALGRLLARRGISVAILEAGFFPKRKPCGESLNPGAIAALGRMGYAPEAELADAAVPLRGWRLHTPRSRLSADYPGGLRGLACPRERLDRWLAESASRAGASLLEGMRVDRLLFDDGRVCGVSGRTERGAAFRLTAPFVVGADGLRSVVARRAGLALSGSVRKIAFTVRLDGWPQAEPYVELYVRRDEVVGIAPFAGGTANMTVVVPERRAIEAAGRKPAFVRQIAGRWPELAPAFERAAIDGEVLACGPFDRPVSAAARPGLMLVGDASGYYDPLTGQGIYRALRGAELAADALAQALASGSQRPLYDYDRMIRETFRTGTRLQRLIDYVCRHPAWLDGASAVLGGWPAATRRLAGLIGDCPPPLPR
ncbi:drug:proton antiporter [Paenibacillus cisolokensis]|uniref:Drug:proton antiporter n=1 Tax=Paenibacillus cisolokensis TaxID=1658519 RepID=A0ABQ4N409_9BACL|nr:FAD-dependent monooxygenase [Paenibacillus cisolokensis]GIQ62897.1 drug:proton antiporter [Paenibacillus cisolokensis]